MSKEIHDEEILTIKAERKDKKGEMNNSEDAMEKKKETENIEMIKDEEKKIQGGKGIKEELKMERIWRDHRVERIWDGTSEIQRHIISRSVLRPFE